MTRSLKKGPFIDEKLYERKGGAMSSSLRHSETFLSPARGPVGSGTLDEGAGYRGVLLWRGRARVAGGHYLVRINFPWRVIRRRYS